MDVITYGCATNQADSEIILGLLREQGLGDEDIVVVNTCTVKSPTENKIQKRLGQLRGKKVVVAGCIPAARESIIEEYPEYSFIGVNTQDVVEAVRETVKGHRYVNIAASNDKSCLPRKRINPFVGILPISEGCLGACSYCQTRNARKNLRSYPMQKLVSEVTSMCEDGVNQIWVTSQDTGCYGKDTGENIVDLLKAICDVEYDFKVRVGMMNPEHALMHADELLKVFESEKLYRFLHIPVQSGDDGVLDDMNRDYNAKDYIKLTEKFSGFTISTDVICGYPTESEEAFNKTIKIVEETKPDIVNISRYWPRPGTKASEQKSLPGSLTKARSRKMNEAFKRIGLEKNRQWIGWGGHALVSSANPDGTLTARNDWYKPIIVEGSCLGDKIRVRVEDATYYDLRGVLV